MQNLELYINNELADLGEDVIQLTFMINNLASVANPSGSGSKQFKLPLTQRNRIILGYPDDIKFTGNLPYTQYNCKLVIEGIEVMASCIGELKNIDNGNANFVVASGNVEFFDAISGSIYQMADSTSVFTDYGQSLVWDQYSIPHPETPLHPDNCVWDLSHVANSQQKTSGWIWPVVDYGAIDPTDFTKWINVRTQRPGFFLHTAIELIVEAAGFTIDPNSTLIQDPLYQKLIIQFANDSFEHSSDFQNQPDNLGLLAYSASNRDVTHSAISDPYGKGIFSFANIQSDPNHQFDGQVFTAKERMSAIIDLVIPKFYFFGRVNKNPSSVDVKIRIHTPSGDLDSVYNFDLTEFTRDNSPGAGSGSNEQGFHTFTKTTISTTADLLQGDQISVIYEFIGGRREQFIMYSGASLSIKSDNVNVLFSQNVQCERILPDVGQSDLLKNTLQMFGSICQTDNTKKTILFISIKDIVGKIPIARNWTSRCIDQGKQISYQLEGYSQVNRLLYKFDDSIPLLLMQKYFADDKILINDKTLNPASPQSDLFSNIFSPSINRAFTGGTIAQILKIDNTQSETDFSISTAPRLLVDQKVDLRKIGGLKAVTFSDGDQGNPDTKTVVVNDVISVPYFFKSNGQYNLCWCDKEGQPGLKTNYYPEVIRILQQTKKVVRYFMLSPRDIMELDLTIPVYLEQDSAYYYILKIDSWSKGNPTKVELVKLY